METLTAKMVPTKIPVFVTSKFVIQQLNSLVRMDDAFQNCGCAILTMIVGMIRTNRLICADRKIVQPAGKDVLEGTTTGT